MTPAQIEKILQQAHVELWRDNLEGALDLLDRANAECEDNRIATAAREIRSWTSHLESRKTYAEAYERYYERVKGFTGLRRLEQAFRIASGRKTRKTISRTAIHPEYLLLLEEQVVGHRARRILDAGCGEGRMALTLAARHADVRVEGIEVSSTNVGLARSMNRFTNVAFHHGLIEEAERRFAQGSFDLAYAFAVLEHVRDVDEVVATLLRLLRPGGRLCFIVPMNGLAATGPVPAFSPEDGLAGHVRVFEERGLRQRFEHYQDFLLRKVPATRWRETRYPPTLAPTEFGSFFVAVTKTR